MPYPYYMALYACVFNYCIEPRRLAREDLYHRLETYLAAHVAGIPPVSQPRLPCASALLRIIDKARHDGGESDPTLFKAIVTSLGLSGHLA
jgi:hypothetical protein